MFVGKSSGFPPIRGVAWAVLVPFFFLSWWIEHRSVARNAPEITRQRMRAATGIANLASYIGMAAPVWFMYPTQYVGTTRGITAEAVVVGVALQSQVTNFWLEQKRFAERLDALGVERRPLEHFEVTLEDAGRIVVRIHDTGDRRVDGKRIELVPSPDDRTRELRWVCGSAEIEPRYLPSSCRDASR